MSGNRFRTLLIMAIGLAALTIAACGGDDDDVPANTTAPTGQTTEATAATTGTSSGGTSTRAATPTDGGALAANRTVEVVKAGYTEVEQDTPGGHFSSFGCGVLLHNNSKTEGIGQVQWDADFFDAAGTLIGGAYGYVYNMLPDETRGAAVCGGQIDPPTADIARMETTVSACATCWERVTTTKRFSTIVTELDRSDPVTYDGRGTATNPFSIALNGAFVEVLWYNAAGDIIGSGGVRFDSIAPGETVNWELQVYVNFTDNSAIDHLEAFVQPNSITELSELQ
jgi:hypothetical protein